jgi:cell wall-associated NlpC family hydrolase
VEPAPDPAAIGRTGDAEPGGSPTSSAASSTVVRTALGLLGVPYRNGGSDPSGFDCSGLVQWVSARHGTALPREVRDQYRVGREIDLDDVEPGDLIFFETIARGASHVGVVIGEGRFLHAPSSNGVVRIEPYNANYWIRRFVGVRRVNETASTR